MVDSEEWGWRDGSSGTKWGIGFVCPSINVPSLCDYILLILIN